MKEINKIKTEAYTEYPIEIPLVFTEPFNHGIHLLINRLEQWQELLINLRMYFENKKNSSIVLCNIYIDSAKALSETCLRPSTVDNMDIASEEVQTSLMKAKSKIGRFMEKFHRLGTNFEFDYAKEGGIMANFDSLRDHAEQIALLEEKRREYLIDFPITNILNLQELLREKQTRLEQWATGLVAAETLKDKAIVAYRDLIIATEQFKMNADSTPLPSDDPLVRWLQYRSLRDSYLSAVNNLKFVAALHQEDCRVTEYTIVDGLQNIIQEYTTTTMNHNTDVKALFSKRPIPFDHELEWEYFATKKENVVLIPQMEIPRRLRFLNDDNPRTIPLAHARLLLHASFPWSVRSSRKPRTYVVTAGGYLIKYPEDKSGPDFTPILLDPMPRTAFRLRECIIQEGFARNGDLSFQIRGLNCCRGIKSGITDRRTIWTFTGAQTEVQALLSAMRRISAVASTHGTAIAVPASAVGRVYTMEV
jgi:hypothetical protein